MRFFLIQIHGHRKVRSSDAGWDCHNSLLLKGPGLISDSCLQRKKQKHSKKVIMKICCKILERQGGLQIASNGLKRFCTMYTLTVTMLQIARNGLERSYVA